MTQEAEQQKVASVSVSQEITTGYKTQVITLEEQVKNMAVKDQKSLEDSTALIRQIEAIKKAANDERLKATRPLDTLKETIMGWFRPMVDKCDELSKDLRQKNQKFLDDQEAKRKAEQAKIDAEAEKEAERQRKIKEDQAAEWKRKEDEKLKEAEKLKAEGKTEEAAKVEKEAAKAGEKAEERLEQAAAVEVQTTIVPSKVAVPKGVAQKKVWHYRITDVDKIPRQFMVPDDALLKKQASACQDKVKIDGVEFYSTNETAYRKG